MRLACFAFLTFVHLLGQIESMLWSDPQDEDGIKPNHRGTGIVFGPDISREFLKRYNLKYLIRSHQPVEKGVQTQACGDNCFVVTVFSTANYPNGEGSNNGGVIHLDNEGNCNSVEFRFGGGIDYSRTIQSILSGTAETILNYHRVLWHDTQRDEKGNDNERSLEELLRSYVADRRDSLEGYFRAVEDKAGLITKLQWCVAMEDVLDLKDVRWTELQPTLAPTVPDDDNYIDWRAYLKKNANEVTLDALQDKQLVVLRDYKDKLMTIFEFLDKEGTGKVTKEVFESAIQLLNRQYVPKNRKITEPEKVFKVLDSAREGTIDLKELNAMLTESQMLALMCQTLGLKQMAVLQQHHEGLTAAFKVMDTEKLGSIDRQAFVAGVELLNKRLPSDNNLHSIDQLFNLLDMEGSGKVDINQFSQLFQSS
jgi:Ca2+-binding EF-hand superfamily protein